MQHQESENRDGGRRKGQKSTMCYNNKHHREIQFLAPCSLDTHTQISITQVLAWRTYIYKVAFSCWTFPHVLSHYQMHCTPPGDIRWLNIGCSPMPPFHAFDSSVVTSLTAPPPLAANPCHWCCLFTLTQCANDTERAVRTIIKGPPRRARWCVAIWSPLKCLRCFFSF